MEANDAPPPFIRTRLSAHYLGLFAPVGVMLPFWPIFLAGRGLSEWEIGVALATGAVAKLAFNPLAGAVVDRMGRRRTAMITLAFSTLFAFSAFWVTEGFWAILILSAVSSGFYAAQMPLAENLSLYFCSRHKLDYGRLRLWGSLSFILAAMGGGWLLTGRDSELVLPICLALLLLMALISLGLPEMRLDRQNAGTHTAGIGGLLADRRFLLFLGTAGMMQASHMVYYGFSTLHWRAAGIGETTIGILWSLGVVAEILLFSQGNRVLRRLGPAGLLFLAGGGGVIRWTVLAFTTWEPALFAAQTLHALTFGAMHLGAMHYLSRNIPLAISARAQGVYSSFVTGIAQGAGMLAAGPLYQAFSGYAFLGMALLSGLGLLAAYGLTRQQA